MPVERRWYEFTRTNIEKIPADSMGAYLLGDKNKGKIYTGSSVNIRNRLITHLIHKTFPTTKYFKFAYANNLDEARDMERQTFEMHIRKNPQLRNHVKRIPRKRKNLWSI